MRLRLERSEFTENSTIGNLYIDDVFFCYTLEDKVRDEKIKRETAIPTGIYEIRLTMSNRFKKVLPVLLRVPNFEGVRIHSGNTKDHTEGCILLGMVKDIDFVGMSRVAMNKLMAKLDKAENITLLIENESFNTGV